MLQHVPALGRLARRNDDRRGPDPGRVERGLRRAKVARRNGFVGDDRGGGSRLQRRDARAEFGDQPPADQDVVGAVAQRHLDDRRLAGARVRGHGALAIAGAASPSGSASAAMISFTMVSCATSRDITVTSASA